MSFLHWKSKEHGWDGSHPSSSRSGHVTKFWPITTLHSSDPSDWLRKEHMIQTSQWDVISGLLLKLEKNFISSVTTELGCKPGMGSGPPITT